MDREPNPYEPPASADEPAAETAMYIDGPRGLGGWLVLPLLGLVATALNLGLSLWRDYLPMFTGEDWALVTDPAYEAYHPLWGPLIIFELLTNVGFIAVIGYALYLASRRSRRFPPVMIGYLVAGVLVILIDTLWAQFIPAIAANQDHGLERDIFRNVAGACIWVPYFLKSRRVKNTFVEP